MQNTQTGALLQSFTIKRVLTKHHYTRHVIINCTTRPFYYTGVISFYKGKGEKGHKGKWAYGQMHHNGQRTAQGHSGTMIKG